MQPIRVVTQAPGARSPAWPPLATDKVRYVGEAIAACVAPTRAEAEDLAAAVAVDYEPLDPVVDARAQMRGRALVHESWGDNLFSERTMEEGDIAAAARDAAIVVTREYRMNRQSGAPMEGRGVVAYRDHRLDEIVVYASTQTPHTVRVAIGETLGLPLHKLRVVAPDVGGGFGPKARLYPEEIILAALALELDFPVRWIEDRSEHLLTAAHTRDHHYKLTAYADRTRKNPRRRCRDHRRCRRLWAVAARPLPGGQHGGARAARPLQDRQLPRPLRDRGDQQGAARPLSRGRPPRRLLRDRAHGGRDRARSRARPGGGARRQHDPARRDALHLGHRECATTPATIRPASGCAPSC